jgi:ketosteroid isomerase-like protein
MEADSSYNSDRIPGRWPVSHLDRQTARDGSSSWKRDTLLLAAFSERPVVIDPIQRKRGGTSMASNLETTKKGYELFKQGDISTLVKDIVDETCTWISPGPQDKLPWAGNFKGRQEITDFFARVAQNLDFTEFAPREMIEQGDTVVVIGTSSARAKRTGKTIKDDWVHIFKYNQGRMVFFQEYTDTAAAVLGMS